MKLKRAKKLMTCLDKFSLALYAAIFMAKYKRNSRIYIDTWKCTIPNNVHFQCLEHLPEL